MGLSNDTKIDRNFKLAYGLAETNILRPYYSESFPSSLLITANNVWGADPTIGANQTFYIALVLTQDPGNANAWLTGSPTPLTNWIPPVPYGSLYQVSIVNQANVPIPLTSESDWIFDYKAGILYIQDPADLPAGTTGIKLSGYRYTGITVSDVLGGASYWTRNTGSGYLYNTTITDNVGIGTTTPGATLEISKSAAAGIATELRITQTYGTLGYTRLKQYEDSSGFILSSNIDPLGGMGGTVGNLDNVWRDGFTMTVSCDSWTRSFFDLGFAVGDGTVNLKTMNTVFRITDRADTSIGTLAANAKLTVYNTVANRGIAVMGVQPSIRFWDNTATPVEKAAMGVVTANGQFLNTSSVGDFVLKNVSANDLLFSAGSGTTTSSMIITSAQRVGIGNSAPAYKLSVSSLGNENIATYITMSPAIPTGTVKGLYVLANYTGTQDKYAIEGIAIGTGESALNQDGRIGVKGEAYCGTYTSTYRQCIGVYGYSHDTTGVSRGVMGSASGIVGSVACGVYGLANGAATNNGVFGYVYGGITNNAGYFQASGASGGSACAVYGNAYSSATTYGIRGYVYGGTNNYASYFQASSTAGATSYGGYFYSYGAGTTNYGIRAYATGASTNWAGYFQGNVNITGSLTKGGGGFLIDHPLEPETKILEHSFVEAPGRMNMYKGRAVLVNGEAIITLPNYFEALNIECEYVLTPIGMIAKLAIKEEVSNNKFKVMGDVDCSFSWIVYGVRKDTWAIEHPLAVESAKGEGTAYPIGASVHSAPQIDHDEPPQ